MKIKVNIVVLKLKHNGGQVKNVYTYTMHRVYTMGIYEFRTYFENLLVREKLKFGKLFFRIARIVGFSKAFFDCFRTHRICKHIVIPFSICCTYKYNPKFIVFSKTFISTCLTAFKICQRGHAEYIILCL